MHARTHGRTSPSGVEAAGARYGPIRAPPPPRKLSLAPGSTRSRPAPVACLKVPNRPSTVLFQAASSRRAGAESGARSASPVRTPPRPTSATTAAHPSSRASAATAERRSAPPAARRRGPGATAWWGSTTITDLGFAKGVHMEFRGRELEVRAFSTFHRLRAPALPVRVLRPAQRVCVRARRSSGAQAIETRVARGLGCRSAPRARARAGPHSPGAAHAHAHACTHTHRHARAGAGEIRGWRIERVEARPGDGEGMRAAQRVRAFSCAWWREWLRCGD